MVYSLLMNSLIQEKEEKKKEGAIFKINLEKAYDHVDCNSVDESVRE